MKTIHDDLSQRSVDIHRPTGFDSENADLFAHITIVIAASAESRWAKLIDAAARPTWYSNPSDVVVDSSGRLGKPWPRSLEHQPQVRLRESCPRWLEPLHTQVSRGYRVPSQPLSVTAGQAGPAQITAGRKD